MAEAHDHAREHRPTEAPPLEPASAARRPGGGPRSAPEYRRPEPPFAARMTIVAMQVYDALNGEQRQRVLVPFDDENRDDWDFLPAAGRRGLPLRDMTHAQQLLVHELLGTALTTEAYAQVVTTITMEHILRELEWPLFGPAVAQFRDPGGYYFTFFGVPNLDATWGWRLVGHHLSLNFTIVRQAYVAVTPFLLGSQPGRFGQLRHLGQEEDLGFELLAALTPSQREQAIIHPVSPVDLVTKSVRRIGDVEFPGYYVVGRHQLKITDDDRKALVYIRQHPRGVPYGALNEAQQRVFRRLLECYVHRVKPEQAAAEMDRIAAAGMDALHFAWAGATSYDAGHYYRVQGPVTVIEFDNTEDDANHIHAIWRDPDNDFGRDLLLRHVVEEHHGYDEGHIHDYRSEQPVIPID